MSPLGATSTSFGCVKYSAPVPPPGLPSVSNNLPAGLNLNTWCPLDRVLSGEAPRPPVHAQSVTQTLSSRSTKIPCGDRNIPAPNEATSPPFASNLYTAGRLDPAQLFAPHRSATQTL